MTPKHLDSAHKPKASLQFHPITKRNVSMNANGTGELVFIDGESLIRKGNCPWGKGNLLTRCEQP